MASRKDQWLANCWPQQTGARVARAYDKASKTAEFILILEDLARYAGLRATSFAPGKSDQTAFNEGQRDLVLHVLEMANLDLCIQPKAHGPDQETLAIQPEEEW